MTNLAAVLPYLLAYAAAGLALIGVAARVCRDSERKPR